MVYRGIREKVFERDVTQRENLEELSLYFVERENANWERGQQMVGNGGGDWGGKNRSAESKRNGCMWCGFYMNAVGR